MKVIDMRYRPPYKSFKMDMAFDLPAVKERYKRRGAEVSKGLENLSMELCLEEMDQCGIAAGVVPIRAKQAREDNPVLVELLNDYPKRFIGMAAVSMPHKNTAEGLEMIEKYVAEGSCAGISLEAGLDFEPWYSDDERIFPLYERCEQLDAPVMILAGGLMHRLDAGDCDYYNPSHLEHVARNFPKLKIILAHGGWPWITQACYLAMNWDNVYLSPDGYMTDGIGGDLYMQAVNNYALQDKIMFGSNFPGYNVAEAITKCKAGGLKEEVYAKFFYDNAAKVFNY